jgi:hypothetical protein
MREYLAHLNLCTASLSYRIGCMHNCLEGRSLFKSHRSIVYQWHGHALRLHGACMTPAWRLHALSEWPCPARCNALFFTTGHAQRSGQREPKKQHKCTWRQSKLSPHETIFISHPFLRSKWAAVCDSRLAMTRMPSLEKQGLRQG